MAAYEADRGRCVAVAMQAQAEYKRQQRLKRASNMTIGLIVGPIAGAAGGGTLGALEGGLAETDYNPVTSPRSPTAALRIAATRSSATSARGREG